ncbi:MAG: MBL fold metallo-hydrolase [Acutalibacteraceae bacterium]
MARRRKKKGGLAAALVCVLMAAAALVRSGQLDPLLEQLALPVQGESVSEQTPAQPVDGLFEMVAIDVGQGDSFLLRTPEQNVLIDAGESEYGSTVLETLEEYGVEQLDLVVVTHMHSDHMGGMAQVLEAVPAETVVMTELTEDTTPTSRVYENLLTALEQSPETEVMPAQPGDRNSIWAAG